MDTIDVDRNIDELRFLALASGRVCRLGLGGFSNTKVLTPVQLQILIFCALTLLYIKNH